MESCEKNKTLFNFEIKEYGKFVNIHNLFNTLRPGDAYLSEDRVIAGSDNGLSPVRCQSMTWTNAELFCIGPSWISFNEISIKTQICFQENALGNVVYNMPAILP